MIIVAERINATRKSIGEAIEKRDSAKIAQEARLQYEAGCDFVDLNAGLHPDSEAEVLEWMIEVVEGVSDDIRISLDSSSVDVLKKNVNKVKNSPMINSVSLESKRFSGMKPILAEREASVVALCMDDKGMPKDAETVFDNAVRLVKELEGLGISRGRIFLDPLVQAVSADSKMGVIALDSMSRIRDGIEGVNIICGLSNISFGLPKRWLINRMFIALAMGAGLNSAIMDPLDKKMMTAITVVEMLLGKDEYCRNFMTQYRKKMLED